MLRNLSTTALAMLLAVSCLIPAPARADADVRQVLLEAYTKMLKSRCVTDTVSKDAKGRETRSRVEFDSLERFRVTSADTSFVVLPEGTWMRSGDGEWMQPPIDMSAMFKRMLPATIQEVSAGMTNVRDLGMQVVDGASLRAISYDMSMKVMGIAVSTHNTSYIDSDGRIVRAVSDGTAMGQTTHTVQTIRYDDSIRISAPN